MDLGFKSACKPKPTHPDGGGFAQKPKYYNLKQQYSQWLISALLRPFVECELVVLQPTQYVIQRMVSR